MQRRISNVNINLIIMIEIQIEIKALCLKCSNVSVCRNLMPHISHGMTTLHSDRKEFLEIPLRVTEPIITARVLMAAR